MNRGLLIGILFAAIAGVGLWTFLRPGPSDHARDARALATRVLAEYLARTYPGERALLVSNPFTQTGAIAPEIAAMENAGIAGIKQGLGGKVQLRGIVFPDLKPEARENPRALFIDGETTTPLSYLVADDAFDKLVAQHPDCGLLISLVGLPASLSRVRCWQTEKPRFALLLPDLRFIGNAAAVQKAVQSGKLAAMILHKPGAPDSRRPLKGRGEFDNRFLLVTRDNIDGMLAQYPQLFPPQDDAHSPGASSLTR